MILPIGFSRVHFVKATEIKKVGFELIVIIKIGECNGGVKPPIRNVLPICNANKAAGSSEPGCHGLRITKWFLFSLYLQRTFFVSANLEPRAVGKSIF